MDKTNINDFIKCPHCGSDNTNLTNTDEIDFNYDGTGHFYFDCYCKDCQKYFRTYIEFDYIITKAWTR